MRKYLAVLGVAGMLAVACAPGAGEISGATDAELDRACGALSRVGYDYWRLDPLGSMRMMEVAADIHTSHPGPEQTRKYCEKRN